ncbi:MAG: Ig-like domain-containing protein [Kofleriaceae bacterium]
MADGPADADTEPPTVELVAPDDDGAGVSVNPTVIVNFSELVFNVSGSTFLLYETSNGVQVPATVSYNPSILGAALVPDRTLLANTVHTVLLDSSIVDAANNPLTTVSWSFSTGDDFDSPVVQGTVPLAAASNVDVNTSIAVGFSEAVYNVQSSSFTVDQAGTPIAGTIMMPQLDQATFTPSGPLPAGATINVYLTGSITDINGNPLAPYMFTFSTAP